MTLSIHRCACFAGVFAALCGCERESAKVYTAPAESSAPASLPAATPPSESASGAVSAPRSLPRMGWVRPEGWQQTAPGQLSIANFTIKTEKGEATVNITPLPHLAGKEAVVVNMWRQQVGQEPLDAGDVSKALSDVEAAGRTAQLFEISGTREGRETRIVTAMLHDATVSWFFKLAGDAPVVEAQKPVFLEFLKSVRIENGESAAPAAASPAPSTPEAAQTPTEFKGTVPAGWQSVAPGQMQVAKFTVPAQGDAKAEVTVSTFAGDTGGTLANVNRWRGQIGLPPTDEASLPQMTSPLDPAIPGSLLVDLLSEQKQMIVAIVPRGDRWWFYKLLGDAPAVAAQREAFVTFAKTQP